MSPAFLVATVLVVGWNLALAATVVLVNSESSQSDEDEPRTMEWSRETVRAEVGRPALDARTAAGTDGKGAPTEAPPRVAESSREVAVDVRYADASVTVMTADGAQLRHCSVCMN